MLARDFCLFYSLLSVLGGITASLNVEEMAYAEHLGPQGVPDPPRNPDPPP